MAAGAAAGKFLHYEEAAPAVAAQTAYGIEAEVEGYENNYDGESMLFMDFRRHHTGLWPDAAPRCLLSQHTLTWLNQPPTNQAFITKVNQADYAIPLLKINISITHPINKVAEQLVNQSTFWPVSSAINQCTHPLTSL